jgi:hypothetical protein
MQIETTEGTKDISTAKILGAVVGTILANVALSILAAYFCALIAGIDFTASQIVAAGLLLTWVRGG